MRLNTFAMAMLSALIPSAVLAQGACIENGGCVPINSVPEPETLALLGVAAVALYIARRRNRK